jgi:prepilin-type N-terminal cleavage/methylation domain-containing protein/prepilin-type processing-associated H-X9-DG protein
MMRRGKGFTLIELLVVISVIVLLMAILLPTLQRIKRQAKAVVCQSNLRESGIIWAAYTDENNGYFPGGLRDKGWNPSDDRYPMFTAPDSWWWHRGRQYWYRHGAEGILCCPMATKIANPTAETAVGQGGGTFLAWGRISREGKWEWDTYGSYGINLWVYQPYYRQSKFYSHFWRTCRVGGASSIPVQLDNFRPNGYWFDLDGPPPRDAVPTAPIVGNLSHQCYFCMNRHNGGINGLFMDWSVRKIGLKELWTLKWSPEFDTANIWTKAGGVRPEDWPEWMRGFKDY